MIYFEHYLRAAGMTRLDRAVILAAPGSEGIIEDLRSEILDIHPGATVDVADPAGPLEPCDLIVLPLTAAPEFPFHDVLHERLDEAARLARVRDQAPFLMIYRALWREVEVIPSKALPRWLRKRRFEAWWIRACRRSALLRRLLRPQYPF